MADNVAITAGTGTSIATDDCGAGGHTQIVKLGIATNGSATLIPADATDGILVNLGTNNDVTVTNAGTFATQIDGSALTALQLIDDTVFADDAAFTIATSKVSAVGGYAVAHGANPDAADAGDAGIFLMNRHRIPFVVGGHPNIITNSVRLTGSTTDGAIIAGTIAGGTKVVVTRISVNVSNATTINVGVRIGFGATTLAADSTTTAVGILIDNDGFPPGGGVNVGDGSGIIGIGGDGEEIRVTNDSPTSGTIHISVSYYTIES